MLPTGKLPLILILLALSIGTASAQERPIVGLIPKAQKPIAFDGKLTGWDGAFVTPVHVGHPDFANRGGQFLYLWDEKNLYIGLRCLDQKPAHVGKDTELYNGDAVEFYLDTRRGDKLGAAAFGPGTLHMFYTAFTNTDVKPRLQVRPLPAFKDSSCKEPRSPPPRQRVATPPSSSCPGRTSPTLPRKLARSSASNVSFAAAMAGQGLIARSSIRLQPLSAVHRLSGECSWWINSTPAL